MAGASTDNKVSPKLQLWLALWGALAALFSIAANAIKILEFLGPKLVACRAWITRRVTGLQRMDFTPLLQIARSRTELVVLKAASFVPTPLPPPVLRLGDFKKTLLTAV